MTAKEQGLPELPEPADVLVIGGQALRGFTADQMRAYALAALASDTGERGVVEQATVDAIRAKWMLREETVRDILAMAALRAQPAGGGTSLTDAGLDRQMQNAVARHDALPDYLKATPPAQAAEAVELVPSELEVSAWPEHRTGMVVGTVSGVKVTHTPSAISVICTAERSMHKNRDRALRGLVAAIAAMQAGE